MKSILLILVALILGCNCTMIPYIGKTHPHGTKTYQVQLNDQPRQRWTHIVPDYLPVFQEILALADLLPIPEIFWDSVEWFAYNQFPYLEYVEEIQGIAKASNIPFSKLFFMNYAYEFSTISAPMCTSVIVRNGDGTIIHGRNLDFEMFNVFSRLIARVEFFKGSEALYQTDQLIGTVFVLTGMKLGSEGKFGITVDTRFHQGGIMGIFDMFYAMIFKQYIPAAYLVRKVLEEENSWADAVKRLNNTNTDADIYYIVSGEKDNEGAVIEKSIHGSHKLRQLNETTWFLVQTNYDEGEKEPLWDRRENKPTERIEAIGQENFSVQDMFSNVMTLWPTFNIASLMTVVMTPATGYQNTTVWYMYPLKNWTNPFQKHHSEQNDLKESREKVELY